MQRAVQTGTNARTGAPIYTAHWSNDGWTKANIISLAIKNIDPIKTGSIDHFYQASLDWADTKRNHTTYGYSISASTLDGRDVTWEEIQQLYKEPLTFKFSTTHILHYGSKVNVLWNNFFTAKGSYKRIIYFGESSTKNAYKTYKFKPSFNWDMRLGLNAGGLYVNLDVYNVLDSKKLIPIGIENGVIFDDVNANAMVLAYELGRQFWLQIGYKF